MSLTETQTKARVAVEALRDIADFIETNPEFADLVSNARMVKYVSPYGLDGETVEQRFIRLARRLGGDRVKDGDDKHMRVIRWYGPVEVELFVERDEVCERVVVGVEEVEVPDPDAPKVTVEREIVEWKCRPLLDRES